MLFYMLQPFSWEKTTPSEQHEDEITPGDTYYISAKSPWEAWEQHSQEPAQARQHISPELPGSLLWLYSLILPL